MTTVPSNLIPTRITQLPEYVGASTLGYFPYVIDGVTYKVQFSNLAAVGAVPSTRTITGGGGLTGGGDLSADRVISIAAGGVGFGQLADSGVAAGTYGDSSNIPVLTVDQKGRVTGATTTAINLTNYVQTSRAILAGDGLTGGGTLAADRTISMILSTAQPQSGGTPAAGTATIAAREDHVHPAVDLSDTTETSGVLPMSRGGTGNSLSPVAGAILYSDGSDVNLSNPGTTDQLLFSGGSGSPNWRTLTGGTTGLTFGLSGSNYALSGTLAVASGGTGAGTAAGARVNLLPSYAGNGSKVLALNSGATDVEWVTQAAGSGTVTSVDVSGGATGLTASGGPITSSGTITLAGTLLAASGGTGHTGYANGQLLIGKADGTLAKSTLTAGTGLSVTNGDGSITLTNTAPDQVVSLTAGSNVTITGSYPNFTIAATGGGGGTVTSVDASGGTTGLTFTGGPVTTSGTLTLGGTLGTANGGTGQTTYTDGQLLIGTTAGGLAKSTLTAGTGISVVNGNGSITVTNSAPDQTVSLAAGTGISVSGSYPSFTVTNSAPDQTVTLTAGSGISVTGSYPSFTIAATGGGGSGTVTSVDVSGGTTGLTFTGGPVTTSGTITAGGTLAVANGGTGATTAPNARTNLGATTVGSNLFTLANPSAITFPRINADNSVSTLDAATFRTAIGAGTGNGTVTSVSGTGTVNGITLTGSVTSSGNLTLGGTLSGVSLTTQVSGTLPVANGGTGVTTTPSNGQLLIGNGTGYSVASLTAGSNVTITPGAGTITISATGGGGSSVTISTTAPSTPASGDLWWNSETGQPYIYYNDGTSSQWVAFALSGGSAGVSVAEARKITSLRL